MGIGKPIQVKSSGSCSIRMQLTHLTLSRYYFRRHCSPKSRHKVSFIFAECEIPPLVAATSYFELSVCVMNDGGGRREDAPCPITIIVTVTSSPSQSLYYAHMTFPCNELVKNKKWVSMENFNTVPSEPQTLILKNKLQPGLVLRNCSGTALGSKKQQSL